MKKNKKLLAVVTTLIAWVTVIWFSTSGRGGTYEIEPWITVPEYRTDTARAIDAYERVMDRFMSLAERNFTGINTDVKDIAKKLDSVDAKLTELSIKITRIEGALGIEQPKKLVKEKSKPKTHKHANELDLKSPKRCTK